MKLVCIEYYFKPPKHSLGNRIEHAILYEKNRESLRYIKSFKSVDEAIVHALDNKYEIAEFFKKGEN